MINAQHAHIYRIHTLHFIFGEIFFLKILSIQPLAAWWPRGLPWPATTHRLPTQGSPSVCKMSGNTCSVWRLTQPLTSPRWRWQSGQSSSRPCWGPLLANDSCGEQKRRWTEGGVERVGTFWFPCPYNWHYKFRHAVDDHNNLRHALPSIEHTITTTRWEMRVFSFVLTVTEKVNMRSLHIDCFAIPILCLPSSSFAISWHGS
jgi:hypothetical protein